MSTSDYHFEDSTGTRLDSASPEVGHLVMALRRVAEGWRLVDVDVVDRETADYYRETWAQ